MLLEGSEHLDGGRGRAAALDDAEQVDARRVREGLREGEEDGADDGAEGEQAADASAPPADDLEAELAAAKA